MASPDSDESAYSKMGIASLSLGAASFALAWFAGSLWPVTVLFAVGALVFGFLADRYRNRADTPYPALTMIGMICAATALGMLCGLTGIVYGAKLTTLGVIITIMIAQAAFHRSEQLALAAPKRRNGRRPYPIR